MGAGDGRRSADGGTESFVDALAALKRRGSALLVVGAVPQDAYYAASRAMLGDDDVSPPRRRLVVVPGLDGHDVVGRLRRTGPVTPDTVRVVTCTEGARSAAADSPDGQTPDQTPGPPDDASSPLADLDVGTIRAGKTFGELGAAVTRSIDELAAAADGPDPAELRVAFDCLPSISERVDEETLFRFLHLLTAQVQAVSGMLHVWLPQPRDARLVRLLTPLFDAVIELRVNGTLTQRWEFRDSDVTSDWLDLDLDPGPDVD